MTKRSIETFFNFPAGHYCGVYLRKRLLKRVLKLQNEYNFKMRQLLAANLDEVQTSNWTLNGNQEETGLQISGEYFDPSESDADKLERIELFKYTPPEVVSLIFESNDRDKVKDELSKIALEKLETE